MATLAHYTNNVKLADIAIPNYSNYITIYNSTSDCTTQSYTVEEDGFLLVKIDLQGNSGNCFYRIIINNGIVIQRQSKENANYIYTTSAPIPVRKGDVITYSLASGESSGKKQLYLLRQR